MSGGTEAFPDLGRHCQLADCHQLDFLPFTCQGCQKVFCLEHRTYKAHQCPRSDVKSRKVVVCEICGSSIEVTGKNGVEAKTVVEKHEKSGDCDPKKKKKPTCPVGRCKETLIFSNTSVCKTCHLKVCLKHRFPVDHACNTQNPAASISTAGGRNQNFLLAFASRNGKDCAKNGQHQRTSSPTTSASTSVKAY